MKIIGLIGSLREESVNRSIFEHYQQLCHGEFELSEGFFADFPVYNADISSPPGSVVKLSDSINDSDGVIFFTPEYNYSVPGGLKNALDWLSRQDPQPFHDKPAAIIGASPGSIGTARMQYHLRQIGVFLNLRFLNRPEVMIGQAYEKVKEGMVVDEKTSDFLKKHVKAFKAFVST